MHRSWIALFAVLMAQTALMASAAENPPPSWRTDPKLTVHGALDAAEARYPDVTLANALAGEALAISQKSRAWLADAPMLSLHYQDDALASDVGLQELEAGLELPLWRPRQRAGWHTLANEADTIQSAYRQVLRWRLAGELREHLWAVALADGARAQARAATESALELQRQIAERINHGELPQIDLNLSRRETLDRKIEQLETEAALANALESYRILTGLDALPFAFKETEAAERDLSDHPLLVLRRLQLSRAMVERDQAVANRLGQPVLSVGARREQGRAEDEAINSVGLGVGIPIGLRAYAGPDIAAAEWDLADAKTKLAREQRELGLAISAAGNQVEIGRQALTLTTERAELAAEHLSLSQAAFDLGEMDLMDFLLIRTAAYDTFRQQDRQRLTLARDIARYNQLLGVMP